MDYLEFFNLTDEPFGLAPLPKFYYASEQHTNALSRLMYAANRAKGLAVLVGDIGRGKTTLARRMLDSLPENQFEAAMLVMVHTGITPSWLLKRIAIQLGVADPADDKLTILSQLYQRLVKIHQSGRKAIVLIDEAQMLQSREIMEEFRGLLNLELPGHKLISFVFFGLPLLEHYLALDPPLAQRVALRYRLESLSEEDTVNYIQHRLQLAGGDIEIFAEGALAEVYAFTKGVPRVINTLCDNVLLEMFFAQQVSASRELIVSVAENLNLGTDAARAGRAAEENIESIAINETPAIDGGLGADAIVAITRDGEDAQEAEATDALSADDIAARIANEPLNAEQEELDTEPRDEIAMGADAADEELEEVEELEELEEVEEDAEDAAEIALVDAGDASEDAAAASRDRPDSAIQVSSDADWDEAPIEMATEEHDAEADDGIDIDIDADVAGGSDEDDAVVLSGVPLDADDLDDGVALDIASPLDFLPAGDDADGGASTPLEAALASNDISGLRRAAAVEPEEVQEEEPEELDVDVDVDVDVDLDLDLDEPEDLVSAVDPIDLIAEMTDPDSSRVATDADGDADPEPLELTDEIEQVAEDESFADAVQPASKSPPAAQTPEPKKRDRKRFTTSTGKVIDLAEIDELLADLD